MYCNYCGKENPEGSKFCCECGKPVLANNSAVQTITKNKTHKLTIFRESQMFVSFMNPAVNITINKNKKLSIDNGQTIELELEEGNYEINFELSVRKRTVNIDLNKDMNVKLKWNRFTGALVAETF